MSFSSVYKKFMLKVTLPLKEYKEVKMSKLGLEFVIENHKFMNVDIKLESSYIVIPYRL